MSTVMPFESIGVITMKMISSTSITSTIGVTLISATGSDAFFFFISFILSWDLPHRVDPAPRLVEAPELNSQQDPGYNYALRAERCERLMK